MEALETFLRVVGIVDLAVCYTGDAFSCHEGVSVNTGVAGSSRVGLGAESRKELALT